MKAKEMLEYKKWAVVGATNNKESYGYKVFNKLRENNYTVYPVTPKFDEIDGVKTYKSIKDIPDNIEVVNFIVSPKIGISIIEDVIDLEIKNIWMQPGTRDPKIIEKATENDINVMLSCVLVELN